MQGANVATPTRGDFVDIKQGGVPYAAIVVGVGR